MNITLEQAEKILKGDLPFSLLGFSMMIARLKNTYAKDPSQTTLQTCADEMNSFLRKFKGAMANDYSAIARL
ncbi:MAG: hypothetical protein FWG71_06195 [Synergistaceae bacterium]|nr:hypothetical protein [Synergistaceae bacterium]